MAQVEHPPIREGALNDARCSDAVIDSPLPLQPPAALASASVLGS